MIIVSGRVTGAPSERRESTFDGTVWTDPVLPTTDGTTINQVFLAPRSRTHWHRHERGQILHITAGHGWIGTTDDEPRPLETGDTVWIPPGETHWHGAGPDSFLLHLAISLGTTEWLAPVTDTLYGPGGRTPKESTR
ncbi:cupin domain-containing protein [Streptomyces sp. NPDC058665]|uniref:cupin domain-containing protein n=1 Tax=Streptomyces sp. NPDC058665 TaxID=3346586 RepID=UPI00365C4D73